jgi:hypothetical protein
MHETYHTGSDLATVKSRFVFYRWMQRATMSCFATSTEQECTMYSTAPAQEQGARLTTMRHRSKDFSQKLRQ